MLGRLVKLRAIPLNNDLGLLILRVLIGLSLFVRHGWQKLFSFSDVVSRVPDILHIGVAPTIFLAAISDAGCSLLIVVGLATRWASAWSITVIFVAWSLRDHFAFNSGSSAMTGELKVLYLSALLALFVTGPGRFSIDARIKDED